MSVIFNKTYPQENLRPEWIYIYIYIYTYTHFIKQLVEEKGNNLKSKSEEYCLGETVANESTILMLSAYPESVDDSKQAFNTINNCVVYTRVHMLNKFYAQIIHNRCLLTLTGYVESDRKVHQIYMHVWVCVCVYIYIYIYITAYVHVCVCVYIYIYIYIYISQMLRNYIYGYECLFIKTKK